MAGAKIPSGWIPLRSSHLAIYLNDHLAGATAGAQLARRAAASNRGSEVGELLAAIATEIGEDRASLLALMRALKVDVDPVKVAAGWTAEKFGRLKLNGRLVGYSPLSRLVELEALALGVRGKLSMWTALEAAGVQARVSDVDLAALALRAEGQLAALEAQRLAVSAAVLG